MVKPRRTQAQVRLDAMSMVKANCAVLKKGVWTQCANPVRRIARLKKLASAALPEKLESV
jgi:hypothetical protein